jgi:hypothetical protein
VVSDPERLRAALTKFGKADRVHRLEWMARRLAFDPDWRRRFTTGAEARRLESDDYSRAVVNEVLHAFRAGWEPTVGACLIYSALKLSVFRRVSEYLTLWWPGWEASLNTAVTLGEPEQGAVQTAERLLKGLPVPLRWFQVYADWVDLDPHCAAGREVRRDVIHRIARDRSVLAQLPFAKAADRYATNKLGALIELAMDDIVTPVSQNGCSSPFFDAIVDVLLNTELAVRWLESGTDMRNVFARRRKLLVEGHEGWHEWITARPEPERAAIVVVARLEDTDGPLPAGSAGGW